jgi:hypothetical protein
MTFTIDNWTNFARVFEIPEEYPEGFLFGGGKPVNFLMVDWFTIGTVPTAAVPREVFIEEVGEDKIDTEEFTHQELADILTPFLKGKDYTKEGRSYLVLCTCGVALIIQC